MMDNNGIDIGVIVYHDRSIYIDSDIYMKVSSGIFTDSRIIMMCMDEYEIFDAFKEDDYHYYGDIGGFSRFLPMFDGYNDTNKETIIVLNLDLMSIQIHKIRMMFSIIGLDYDTMFYSYILDTHIESTLDYRYPITDLYVSTRYMYPGEIYENFLLGIMNGEYKEVINMLNGVYENRETSEYFPIQMDQYFLNSVLRDYVIGEIGLNIIFRMDLDIRMIFKLMLNEQKSILTKMEIRDIQELLRLSNVAIGEYDNMEKRMEVIEYYKMLIPLIKEKIDPDNIEVIELMEEYMENGDLLINVSMPNNYIGLTW